jgi:uncharacterized cofD-like protein
MGNNMKKDLNIVVVGGGTGSFTLLSALKNHTNQLSAIVNMVDDGGSTGVLRDELGALPPGDVRQCLVALSDSPKIRELFNYRFEEGTFEGHPFGNIFLTALEKMSGSFNDAIKTASEILRVNGKVIPATLDDVRLKMIWEKEGETLVGQKIIATTYFVNDPRKARLSLVPKAVAKRRAGELITLGERLEQRYINSLIGSDAAVLFEEESVEYPGFLEGYSERYIRVAAVAAKNEIKTVRLKDMHGLTAFGE